MSVSALYAARAAAGEVSLDPAQEAAAARLSELIERVRGWAPGFRTILYGQVGPGARGVYLHGDVGRGKSMLMDLFFEGAPIEPRRRVHFHAFMQEVQAGIQAARAEVVVVGVAQGSPPGEVGGQGPGDGIQVQAGAHAAAGGTREAQSPPIQPGDVLHDIQSQAAAWLGLVQALATQAPRELFVRWPGRLSPETVVAPIAAHVDLMPTLLDAAGGDHGAA